MTILQAIIYGIVQGLGEFLPISSSAHLAALPRIMGWQDPGLAFDVALHLGTLLAVVVFFWKDWVKLIYSGFARRGTSEGRLFWFIVIASVPGAIIGKLFEEKAETTFRNLALIGIMMIVMGIVLYLADRMSKNNVPLERIGLGRSFLIGLSQALAIIPGVSRSGITMASGLFSGLKKEDTAKFSFLLSTPIVFGAGILKLKDIVSITGSEVAPFIVGIVTSAIVGFIAIKFLLDYLRRNGFGIFVIYRVIVGCLLIGFFFLK